MIKISQGRTDRIDPHPGIVGATFVEALNPSSSYIGLIGEQILGEPVGHPAKTTPLANISEDQEK